MATSFKPDASVSAAALHLLLTQHPDLVDLPVTWTIEPDATIRPFLRVDDPQTETTVQLLATALELDVAVHGYTGSEGVPMRSYRLEGRWAGAPWLFVTYAAVPAVEGVS